MGVLEIDYSPEQDSTPLSKASAENERRSLTKTVRDWGYFNHVPIHRRELWRGKRVLDVGMGAGPHSVGFVESGAASYVGVDPQVGLETVRDFRSPADPSVPAYHAFPFTIADIARLYPNIHLYQGLLEDVAPAAKVHQVDIAMMSAVTEHLRAPEQVFRAIWEILQPGGHLWATHCNYYSWNGHHRDPRSAGLWDRNDAVQTDNVDWKHLDPAHPAYVDPTLNRIRLDDFRLLVSKYFEIVEWKVVVEGCARLGPQIRERWKKYSLEELLGQYIDVVGRRRDVPLDLDFGDRQFFHPNEGYMDDVAHGDEDIVKFELYNSVFFSRDGDIHSHSDNAFAGLKVFERLSPGDAVTVAKFPLRYTLTISQVIRPPDGKLYLKVVEPVPERVRVENHSNWTIERFEIKNPIVIIAKTP